MKSSVQGFWGKKDTNLVSVEKEKVLTLPDDSKTLNKRIFNEVTEIQNNYDKFSSSLKFENDAERLADIKDAIEGLEMSKALLLQEFIQLKQKLTYDSLLYENGSYSRLNEIKDYIKIEQPVFKGNEFIEINLDFSLPHYPKNISNKLRFYRILNTAYKFNLTQKLMESNIPKLKEKIFVQIIHHMKENQIVDLDNRFHSFIFNSLRAAHILQDDSWQDICYMENGVNSKKSQQHTTVLISNYKDIQVALEYTKEKFE